MVEGSLLMSLQLLWTETRETFIHRHFYSKISPEMAPFTASPVEFSHHSGLSLLLVNLGL